MHNSFKWRNTYASILRSINELPTNNLFGCNIKVLESLHKKVKSLHADQDPISVCCSFLVSFYTSTSAPLNNMLNSWYQIYVVKYNGVASSLRCATLCRHSLLLRNYWSCRSILQLNVRGTFADIFISDRAS